MTVIKTQKQPTILYRVSLKQHPGIIVYQCLSSDEITVYDVTMVDGKVNNCSCPARKPCYHMVGCQSREDERNRQLMQAISEPRRNLAPLNNRNQGFSLLR